MKKTLTFYKNSCFFASRLEPEEYTTPKGYPSKWYKFESFYGKTKIVYND